MTLMVQRSGRAYGGHGFLDEVLKPVVAAPAFAIGRLVCFPRILLQKSKIAEPRIFCICRAGRIVEEDIDLRGELVRDRLCEKASLILILAEGAVDGHDRRQTVWALVAKVGA
jgi:hypothetical protein